MTIMTIMIIFVTIFMTLLIESLIAHGTSFFHACSDDRLSVLVISPSEFPVRFRAPCFAF